MGSVSDWISREYGVRTTSTSRVVAAVAAAPVELMQSNPNRFAATFVNLGAAIAYIGFDANVAAANGIYLAANGGMLSFTALEDMEIQTRQMYVLGAGATNVQVIETTGL
jgi:hypothetical protein